MDYLRTPDERFANLPGYPFQPQYVDVAAGDGTATTLRVHVVDEGPRDAAETVLMVHGEPSWSYLYRAMIPLFTAAGHRAVAPDLVGFGRSDKPTPRDEYTYQRHVDWLRETVLDRLGLDGITLVCQDWGGLLGLRLVAEHRDRFRRVVAANTFLPTGDRPAGEAFMRWRNFSQRVETLDIGRVVQGATVTELPGDVVAAYDAPFPDEGYKEGARQFPALVPITPDDPATDANRRAWKSLERFDGPFLCAFSDSDPVTAGADRVLTERIPGAAGQPHATLAGGGHFLQEDVGPELAAVTLDLIDRTR
jgi:haloalkane dehalogenase